MMQRLETYIDFNAEETALLPSPLISGMCASPHVLGALASGGSEETSKEGKHRQCSSMASDNHAVWFSSLCGFKKQCPVASGSTAQ
jgi:hypothetical protein